MKELTLIFIKDRIDGYTVFYAEFPHLIAEGESIYEAESNLIDLLQDVLIYSNSNKN